MGERGPSRVRPCHAGIECVLLHRLGQGRLGGFDWGEPSHTSRQSVEFVQLEQSTQSASRQKVPEKVDDPFTAVIQACVPPLAQHMYKLGAGGFRLY